MHYVCYRYSKDYMIQYKGLPNKQLQPHVRVRLDKLGISRDKGDNGETVHSQSIQTIKGVHNNVSETEKMSTTFNELCAIDISLEVEKLNVGSDLNNQQSQLLASVVYKHYLSVPTEQIEESIHSMAIFIIYLLFQYDG